MQLSTVTPICSLNILFFFPVECFGGGLSDHWLIREFGWGTEGMILDLVRERIVTLCVCTSIASFLGENHATNSGSQLFFVFTK